MSGFSIPNFQNPSLALNSRFLPTTAATKHVVVLLHAFPFSSEIWLRMTEHFQSLRADTAFILIDFPGFGRSAPRPHWEFPSLGIELRGIIEHHTRKPVVLAGLSMGGYAALEFYHMNSDIIRGMVLSNTRAEADSLKELLNRAEFADDALARGPVAAIERVYPNFVTQTTAFEIAEEIRNWILETDPGALAAAQKAMADRIDSCDTLPHITVPTLVIASDLDRVTRTTSLRKMASAIPNSSLVEIKGAAHLSAVEKPQEWARALAEFLDHV
jgi:pimeloyl-ACP methyl ester carboxylesterase